MTPWWVVKESSIPSRVWSPLLRVNSRAKTYDMDEVEMINRVIFIVVLEAIMYRNGWGREKSKRSPITTTRVVLARAQDFPPRTGFQAGAPSAGLSQE